MKKKIFICLAAVAVLGGSIAMPTNDVRKETVTVSAAVYSEVPEGYIGVYTIDDLYAVRNNLSGNYILMNDIDMSATAPGGDWDSGNGWEPIGGEGEEVFMGTFDGNGYAIKNMHIYGETSGYLGLFGKCGGIIKRLALVNCDIDINVPPYSEIYVGSIAGGSSKYHYTSSLQYCYATGNIKVAVACADYADLLEAYGVYYIGGLAGDSTVTDSFNNCNISLSVTNDTSHGNLKNYFIVGGVSGYDGHVVKGGGRSSGQYLYNTGTIEITKDDGLGEYIIGNIFADGENCLSNCYYLKTSSDYTAASSYADESFSNVSARAAGQMKSSSTFTGFDFDNVWTIDPNAEYQYPTLTEVPYVNVQTSVVEPTQPSTELPLPTEVSKGDINGDGLVDAVDASIILGYYSYLSTKPEDEPTMTIDEYQAAQE